MLTLRHCPPPILNRRFPPPKGSIKSSISNAANPYADINISTYVKINYKNFCPGVTGQYGHIRNQSDSITGKPLIGRVRNMIWINSV